MSVITTGREGPFEYQWLSAGDTGDGIIDHLCLTYQDQKFEIRNLATWEGLGSKEKRRSRRAQPEGEGTIEVRGGEAPRKLYQFLRLMRALAEEFEDLYDIDLFASEEENNRRFTLDEEKAWRAREVARREARNNVVEGQKA